MSATVRNEDRNFTSTIYEHSRTIVTEVVEKIASTSIGQTLLKHSDHLLWIIEKSTEWFTPAESRLTDSKNGKHTETRVVRPLPWLLFIPMLLFLRISKASVNIGMFLLGLEPVQATSVIKFLHLQRRKIRSMRVSGLHKLNEQKVNTSSLQRDHEGKNWREHLINKLLNTFCLSRTSYEQIKQNETELFIYKEKVRKNRNEEMSSSESSDYEPILDKNVIEKLKKFAYANSNSDTDPDCKNEEELLTEDSISEGEMKGNSNYVETKDTKSNEIECKGSKTSNLLRTVKVGIENFVSSKEEEHVTCEVRKTENEQQLSETNNIHNTSDHKLSNSETLHENSNIKESSDLLTPNNTEYVEKSTNFFKLSEYNASPSKNIEINSNTEGLYDIVENPLSDNLKSRSALESIKEITSNFMEEAKASLFEYSKSDYNYSNPSPETSGNKSNVEEETANVQQNVSNTEKNVASVITKSFHDENVSHLLESTLKNGRDVNVDVVKETLVGKNKLNKKSKYHKRKAVHRLSNRKK